MLKIYIDFKSPASYLAFKPTLNMLERYQITAQWIPFQTKQEPLVEVGSNESRGDSHRRVRAQSRHDTHLLYAKLQNTPMKFPPQPGETDQALAALLQIKKTPEKFIRSAFGAYWVDNANLNDIDVVSTLLTEVNVDSSSWDRNTSIDQLKENQNSAEEASIVEAPAFVIDSQIFIGREHLPWIEAILASNVEK